MSLFESITTTIVGFAMAVVGIFSPAEPEMFYVPVFVEPSQEESSEPAFGAFSPAAGDTYRLRSSIGTTDTTINLSSFTEPVSNLPITMASLDTDIAYGTLDPQSSTRKEFISFTGVTQNADGTAVLTGVTRGLAFTSPFTASSTLRRSHPGQSIFILSDSPQFFNEYARRRSDETITGHWSVPAPTASDHIATRQFVLDNVAGGTVTQDSIAVAGRAGETFATGTIVYFDNIQTEWMRADASVAASSTGVQLGVAQGPGADTTSISGGVLTQGLDETNTSGTPGDLIYLSDTAGATSTSPGTNSVVLGEISATGEFYFDPIFGNIVGVAQNNTFTGQNTFSATTTFTGNTVGLASSSVQVYTATSTWTNPGGNLKHIIVEGVGGGGAGAGSDTSSNEAGSAGGGGGYFKIKIDAKDLPATVQVGIGTGGTGILGAVGSPGGDTTFGSFATGSGGAAGARNGSGDPVAGGLGGTATGGDINISGGRGGYTDLTDASTANDLGCHVGGGGDSQLSSRMPDIRSDDAVDGVDGNNYGGGGSGTCNEATPGPSQKTGGDGADGIVIVTEFF